MIRGNFGRRCRRGRRRSLCLSRRGHSLRSRSQIRGILSWPRLNHSSSLWTASRTCRCRRLVQHHSNMLSRLCMDSKLRTILSSLYRRRILGIRQACLNKCHSIPRQTRHMDNSTSNHSNTSSQPNHFNHSRLATHSYEKQHRRRSRRVILGVRLQCSSSHRCLNSKAVIRLAYRLSLSSNKCRMCSSSPRCRVPRRCMVDRSTLLVSSHRHRRSSSSSSSSNRRGKDSRCSHSRRV